MLLIFLSSALPLGVFGWIRDEHLSTAGLAEKVGGSLIRGGTSPSCRGIHSHPANGIDCRIIVFHCPSS